MATASSPSTPLKFTYFPLFAKGPAVAVALEMSGLEWEGAFPEDWKTMKEQTPWRTVPIMDIPGVGVIGHEIAMLNWIAQEVPEMGGKSTKDLMTSQQLLWETEDIFKALGRKQDTVMVKGKVSDEEYLAFWGEKDSGIHNKDYSIAMYMQLLEDMYNKSGSEGTFTTTGRTIGECKTWTLLHILTLVKEEVLANFPGLTAFYKRFSAEKEAQSVLNDGAKMPGKFNQAFVPKVLKQAVEGGA